MGKLKIAITEKFPEILLLIKEVIDKILEIITLFITKSKIQDQI